MRRSIGRAYNAERIVCSVQLIGFGFGEYRGIQKQADGACFCLLVLTGILFSDIKETMLLLIAETTVH